MAKEEEPIAAPADNAVPLNYKEAFSSRHVASQYINPCEAASQESLKCLARNDYDRKACADYFRAYRECHLAWINARKDDRRHGRPTE